MHIIVSKNCNFQNLKTTKIAAPMRRQKNSVVQNESANQTQTSKLQNPFGHFRQSLNEFKRYLEENGINVVGVDPDYVWVTGATPEKVESVVSAYPKYHPKVLCAD